MSLPIHIAAAIIGNPTHGMFLAADRTRDYKINSNTPNVIPDAEALVDLQNRRFITSDCAAGYLAKHGIERRGDGGNRGLHEMWNAVFESRREVPSVEDVIDWRRRDILTPAQFDDLVSRVSSMSAENLVRKFEGAYTLFDLDEGFDLWRRGKLDRELLLRLIQAHGYSTRSVDGLFELRNRVLGETESLELWRRNRDNEKEVRHNLRVHGYDELSTGQLISLAQPLLADEQMLALWLRGEWDENRVRKELGRHGYDIENVEYLKQLSQEIPPIGDVVRYMVRNVYDEDIVAAFDLNAEFGQKFGPQLAAWAKGQGVGDEWIKAEWRAHWQIPAPTQLYEMVRRLRPEKYAALPAGDAGNLSVTLKDVDRALGENDVLPFWRRRLLEISYNPLGKIDLRRGFNIGVFTETDLVSRYQDIGYSPADAAKQLEIAKVLRLKTLDGHKAVTAYQAGVSTAAESIDYLATEGLPADVAGQALDRARKRMRWDSRKQCLPAIKARYMVAEFDHAGAMAQLTGQGLDASQANELVTRWECQRSSKSKLIPAGQLCTWYVDGLLSAAEYGTRLGRLGFRQDDVARMLRACQGKVEQKIEADAKRALTLANASKKLRDKARAAAQRALAKRLKLAEKMSGKWGVSVAQVEQAIDDQMTRLQRDQGDTIDAARIAVLSVIDAGLAKQLVDLPAAVDEAREAQGRIITEAGVTPAEAL